MYQISECVDPDKRTAVVVTCNSCWEETVLDGSPDDDIDKLVTDEGFKQVVSEDEIMPSVCRTCLAEIKGA